MRPIYFQGHKSHEPSGVGEVGWGGLMLMGSHAHLLIVLLCCRNSMAILSVLGCKTVASLASHRLWFMVDWLAGLGLSWQLRFAVALLLMCSLHVQLL